MHYDLPGGLTKMKIPRTHKESGSMIGISNRKLIFHIIIKEHEVVLSMDHTEKLSIILVMEVGMFVVCLSANI